MEQALWGGRALECGKLILRDSTAVSKRTKCDFTCVVDMPGNWGDGDVWVVAQQAVIGLTGWSKTANIDVSLGIPLINSYDTRTGGVCFNVANLSWKGSSSSTVHVFCIDQEQVPFKIPARFLRGQPWRVQFTASDGSAIADASLSGTAVVFIEFGVYRT